jgi:hypothetical protein
MGDRASADTTSRAASASVAPLYRASVGAALDERHCPTTWTPPAQPCPPSRAKED